MWQWTLYICDWINYVARWACWAGEWAIYAAVAGTVVREWVWAAIESRRTITLNIGGMRQ